MKKLYLLLTATLLLCLACEKDENGYRIAYSKNKTVSGHCFYFCDLAKDSIWPAKNISVTIESIYCWSRWGPTCKEHYDIVFTDEFGKYTFNNIVKTIDGKKVTGYFITPSIGSVPAVQSFSYDDFNQHNYIQLDTFFIWH